MTENEWTTFVQALLNDKLVNESLEVRALGKLPYAMEVRHYRGKSPEPPETMDYQTDLMIVENGPDSTWKPRLIIELKVRTVTTHDAITYSQKAFSHKSVHPYLRYGILTADRRHYPLPGRLYRHGVYFDFMASWVGYEPTEDELQGLVSIIRDEVEASRSLEEIIYNSRSRSRAHFTYLHRPLKLY